MSQMPGKTLRICVCMFIFLIASISNAAVGQKVEVVTTMQQGLHQWSIGSGQLILIAGTDEDTTRYKRSFTFYFRETARGNWLHVPIIEGPVDFAKTWYTASRGESTLADTVVIVKGNVVRLVIVSLKTSGMSVDVDEYNFVQEDPQYPDGPAYLFKKTARNSLPVRNEQTVSGILEQEVRRMKRN